jgi:hypothetical protein
MTQRFVWRQFVTIRTTLTLLLFHGGQNIGRTKAAATNMGLWQVGADGSY